MGGRFFATRFFHFVLGAVLCGVALVLPYRARVAYNRALSFVFHTPFVLFGFLARFLLDRLSLYPEGPGASKPR